MNIRNRQAKLFFLSWVERHAVSGLRHVFTYQPQAGHVFILFHRARILTAPSSEISVGSEVAGEERQTEVQCLHIIATNECATRFMISLVLDTARHGDPAVHPYGFIEY